MYTYVFVRARTKMRMYVGLDVVWIRAWIRKSLGIKVCTHVCGRTHEQVEVHARADIFNDERIARCNKCPT